MTNEKRGAITALIASLPLAMLFTVVYRFPIPFGEYSHGIKYLPVVLVAWIFYGIFGGFIIMAGGGALIGMAIGRRIINDNGRKWMITISAIIYAPCGVAFLSVLDKIIGPW